MLINTIEALQQLYVALGGDIADVQNITITPEMISALTEVAAAAASELPAVKPADNGKLLGVSSGKWTKVNPPTDGSLYIDFGMWTGYGDLVVSQDVYTKVRGYSSVVFEDMGAQTKVICHAYEQVGSGYYAFVGIVRGTGTTTYYTFKIDITATGSKTVAITKVVVNDPASGET